MAESEVRKVLGRKLRLAVIGGGPGSFIGGVHRMASRIDNNYEIVAAVLSSDPAKSIERGLEIGLDKDRAYSNLSELLKSEVSREDGAEVIAIMTPNDTHFEYSMAALESGLHVICDKPMTNTVEDALALFNKVEERDLTFSLTHNYTGYAMVRQAREMIAVGRLGELRLVQVEYVQGGRSGEEGDPKPGTKGRAWKYDPVKSGPSLVLGDIGCHAHNLLRYVTGLEVIEVCAEAGHIVPDRIVDDYAGALLRLEKGVRGNFWVTQAAAGMGNCLRLRVSGSLGTIEWEQEFPQTLTFRPVDEPRQIIEPNGPGTLPLSKKSTRIAAGHPEGFPAAFANIYSDAGVVIASKIAGVEPDKLAVTFPNAYDGLMGVKFIDAVIKSSKNNSSWEKIIT